MGSLPYEELFRILRNNRLRLNDHAGLLQCVLAKKEFNFSEHAEMILAEPIRKFCIRLYKKWVGEYREEKRFIKNNTSWLKNSLNFSSKALSPTAQENESRHSHEKKPFSDLSDRQKRRRTEELRESNSEKELLFAAKMKMQSSGNSDVAKILTFLMENPDHASVVREFCEGKYKEKTVPYTKEKALAIMLALKLSQSRYLALRKLSVEDGKNRYPSYHDVLTAKKECYPPEEDITITETYAEIKLQALLNLTVQRLIQTLKIDIHEACKLRLICKWGFDGASGQSLYKQKFTDTPSTSDCDKPADSSIVVTLLVPLRLIGEKDVVLWENPQPSSTKYCRPVKFHFQSETAELIKAEHERMQTAINNLTPTRLSENVSVQHQLLLTMIDGKICSTLAGFSSMKCYICGATPKEMNNLKIVSQKPCESEHYRFGISSLHAWIRCMEFLLHISYNLQVKKWSVRRAEEKAEKQIRKKKIQQEFRKRLGLLVDVIKQGVGTTNDGNTARTFFENPSVTADITGLDETVVKNFAVILQAIASGQQIDANKFDMFAKKLARLVVEKYPWYYMPASVHKILLHGGEIVKYALLPIGQLSEEAVEARHKEIRRFRHDHSRKINRKLTNVDILHMLLLTSDPYISSLKPVVKRKKEKELFPETLNLLMTVEAGTEEIEEVENSEDESG